MIHNPSSKEARGERLHQLRLFTKLKAKDFASLLGISRATVYAWEAAELQSIDNARALIISAGMEKIGIACSLPWILQGEGAGPSFLTDLTNQFLGVRETSPYPSNYLRVFEKEPLEYYTKVEEETRLFLKLYEHSTILRVSDNAMLPDYEMEDYVGGCWYQGNIIDLIETPCVIKLANGICLLRKFLASDQDGMYHVYSTNQSVQIETSVLSNAKIIQAAPISRIWKLKKFG